MAKQTEPLPPMTDEPNQAETDKQQAEIFRATVKGDKK